MTAGYYTSQSSKLLREFDQTVGRVRDVLVERFGEGLATTVVGKARQVFESLLPQLPYLGGRQPFTQWILSTAWFLSMYRVLEQHGRTVEEAGQLVYDLSAAFLEAYPAFMRRLLGYRAFSRRHIRSVEKRAAESQQRQYPGDYVFAFVEGDGEAFDYGVDYTECAACKFLTEQGAPELAPYICATDVLSSDALGWGLVRTMTLAEGYEKCDFRFKKGGKTRVPVPEASRDRDL